MNKRMGDNPQDVMTGEKKAETKMAEKKTVEKKIAKKMMTENQKAETKITGKQTAETKIVEREGTSNPITGMRNLWKSKSGEGYIDVTVMVLCVMIVIALGVRVFPIFITKIQMDNFADELIREAEISGRVGGETAARQGVLEERMGIHPVVSWSRSGNIQLNEEVTVTVTMEKNLGLFGRFGSFPIILQARASGKSEVYYK